VMQGRGLDSEVLYLSSSAHSYSLISLLCDSQNSVLMYNGSTRSRANGKPAINSRKDTAKDTIWSVPIASGKLKERPYDHRPCLCVLKAPVVVRIAATVCFEMMNE